MLHQRLQMKLESSEPKCANCKHWRTFGGTIRPCNLGTDPTSDQSLAGFGTAPIASITRDGRLYVPSMTTDLTVCSKWEMKD